MTCSHNVVFVLDTASSVSKAPLHLGTLRILNYLGCRFGLAKVRWSFKFFDSLGAQSRTSRVGSFRELGSRSWEDFEEALEVRFGSQDRDLCLPDPVPRAAFIRNVLKETLLDYQWDRPEITSPAKPVLRSQKSKLTVTLDKPIETTSISEGFVNTIFLFSPCPHTQRELLQFVSGNNAHLSDELPISHALVENLVPKRIQEMMAGQKITLHWVDTSEWSKLLESTDHVGYWMLDELMHFLGGTILSSETLIQNSGDRRMWTSPAFPVESRFSEPSPWTTILPFDSALNYLFSLPSALRMSFPPLEGVVIVETTGVTKPQSCDVILEPLTMNQRCFKSPVNIVLKCVLTGWNGVHAGVFRTESWVLQHVPPEQSTQGTGLFQQLVKSILAQGVHMVAEVFPFGVCSAYSGIFSPISDSAAVLSLLCAERSGAVERCLRRTAVEGNIPIDEGFSFPDTVSRILNEADDPKEGCLVTPAEDPFPEWAQQELSHTQFWNPSVIEGWYPLSNLCGASSHLMESFRLLQAASATEEKASNPEMSLTCCLSKFYQRKASEVSATSCQRDQKKRRGIPRTPVRQKMKTMPRSLQMLNVARLNIKAQKFQPDAEPLGSAKISQKRFSRSSADKVEKNGRMAKSKLGFKTEEELRSFLAADYQKAVASGENLLACAQSMVTAVNTFWESNDGKDREAACRGTIQSSLLKTSKAIRQQIVSSPDQEAKVQECQLQVFLRLEMCLQCPSLQSNTDEMEQLVEVMTEMLRLLCLSEDAVYLSKVLEEIVEIYKESIPKTLGDLYYSLGIEIPPKLASALPADFFSDDAMSQDSQVPSLATSSTASVSASRTTCLSTEADQLEELRTRSAKKRKNTLARHRSVTEASQNLRQIEVPQVFKNRNRKDSSRVRLDENLPPSVQKPAVQEMTKVRRNLFNEKLLSPGKRSLKKIPRSQSVSALEGLKHSRSQSSEGSRDHRKLLTKRVAETPLHKQISRRLLHKQIEGRCSDPGPEVGIVEESPERPVVSSLRRSPRIKKLSLDRTLSGSFYASQPVMGNIQLCSAHLKEPRVEEDFKSENAVASGPTLMLTPVKATIQSPKSLLFGMVLEVPSVRKKQSPRTRRRSVALDGPSYQTPRKTFRSSQRLLSPLNNMPRRSPQTRDMLRNSPAPKQTAAKNLGNLFFPSKQKRKLSPNSLDKDDSAETALPTDRLAAPYKLTPLETPEKHARKRVLSGVFGSPASSSSSADAPFSMDSWGKSPRELQSPRQSLRISPKTASPISAQKWTQERENPLNPELLETPGKQAKKRVLSGVIGSPASSSSSAGALFPVSSGGRSPVELLQSPRRSLRISPKTASPPSAQKWTCNTEDSLDPESQIDSVLSEVMPGVPSEQASDPKSAWVIEAFSSEAGSPFWLDLNSLTCDMSLTTVAPSTLSPPNNQGLGIESCTPKKSPGKPLAVTNISPPKALRSPSCMSEEYVKAYRSNEKPQHSDSTSLSAIVNLFCESGMPESVSLVQRNKLMTGTMTPNRRASLERPRSLELSDKGHVPVLNTIAISEPLDTSSLVNALASKSCTSNFQAEQGVETSQDKPPSLDQPFQSPPKHDQASFPAVLNSGSCTYALRCTADRRQREAAARLGNTKKTKVDTRRRTPVLPSATSPPIYEVELELQTSGLPKLRIKKVGSGSTVQPQSSAEAGRLKGEESSLAVGDLSVTWCGRHPAKVEPTCRSPPCSHSTHSTPGKLAGGQTYICSSYTPTRCPSSSVSPSHGDAGISWTPSPKQKGKVTPEGIKDWPRRKRAIVGCNRSDRPADTAGEVSTHEEEGGVRASELCSTTKALAPGDFELEGVFRLQDESPCGNLELNPDDRSPGEKCRKRVFEHLSPEEEAKRMRQDLEVAVCSTGTPFSRTSPEKVGFSFSGLTPPESSAKTSISASSLWALTQSPLLYQGRASSRRRCPTEDDSVFPAASEDLSPFRGVASRRRSITRTYSRKRLLS